VRTVFLIGGLGAGGNETHLHGLLARIDRTRIEPHVIALSDRTGLLSGALDSLGIPYETVPLAGRGLLWFIGELRRRLRKMDAHAVVCFTWSKLHLAALFAARAARVPKRLAVVSGSPRQVARRWKVRLIQWLSRAVCTRQVAVSESVKAQLIEIGGFPANQIEVIPNGCDVDRIATKAREARNARSESTVDVIMVARLDPIKDHETVICAMSRVSSQEPGVRLVLVGDGPLRLEIEGRCAELGIPHRLLGDRGDVPVLLGRADIFVLASRSEGFGLALIEAMAAGLPVVASDIPAFREILDGGRFGDLFAAGDPDCLARALLPLIGDCTLRNQRARAAYTGARRFDIDENAERFQTLILDAPGGAPQ